MPILFLAFYFMNVFCCIICVSQDIQINAEEHIFVVWVLRFRLMIAPSFHLKLWLLAMVKY